MRNGLRGKGLFILARLSRSHNISTTTTQSLALLPLVKSERGHKKLEFLGQNLGGCEASQSKSSELQIRPTRVARMGCIRANKGRI